MNNTIEMSADIQDDNSCIIKYYSVEKESMGQDICFNMCIGDLYKIANVLFDYEGILRELSNLFPEDYPGNSKMINEIYADQLRKIRSKIEKQLGYSVEEAIVKCEKKNQKKSDDIGEDAMVLAVKRHAENAKEKKEKMVEESKNKKKKKDNQMTLEQMGVVAK